MRRNNNNHNSTEQSENFELIRNLLRDISILKITIEY